jgi:hypothetical protein
MRLFGDVLCQMSEVKPDARAMPTRPEPSAFDDGDLMRHNGVRRIVRDCAAVSA